MDWTEVTCMKDEYNCITFEHKKDAIVLIPKEINGQKVYDISCWSDNTDFINCIFLNVDKFNYVIKDNKSKKWHFIADCELLEEVLENIKYHSYDCNSCRYFISERELVRLRSVGVV